MSNICDNNNICTIKLNEYLKSLIDAAQYIKSSIDCDVINIYILNIPILFFRFIFIF